MTGLIQNIGIHLSWLNSSKSNRPKNTNETFILTGGVNSNGVVARNRESRPIYSSSANEEARISEFNTLDDPRNTVSTLTDDNNEASSRSIANINSQSTTSFVDRNQPTCPLLASSNNDLDIIYVSDTERSAGPTFHIASDDSISVESNTTRIVMSDAENRDYSVLGTIASNPDELHEIPYKERDRTVVSKPEYQTERDDLIFSCQNDLIALLERQVSLLRSHCILEDFEEKQLKDLQNDVETTKNTLDALMEGTGEEKTMEKETETDHFSPIAHETRVSDRGRLIDETAHEPAVLGSSPSITAISRPSDSFEDDFTDIEEDEQVIASSDFDPPTAHVHSPLQHNDPIDEDLGITLSDFSAFDSDIEQTGFSILEESERMGPPPLPVSTPLRSKAVIAPDISPEGVYSQIQFTDVVDETHPWSNKVQELLHEKFQLTSFRGNQLKAINATLSKKDVLVLMPTGGGKSLCYQLPALVDEGTTIVVSPLISLMQDQISHLMDKNIRAQLINSRCSLSERNQTFRELSAGDIDLLYVSPEMLQASQRMERELMNLYEAGMLARLVIDEAHCVSSWGHDFRPDYKLLENMKDRFPDAPIMALTATANERVRLDILRCLRSERTVLLQQSFNRPNLFYEVLKKNGKNAIDQTVEFIEKYPSQCGIIYCNSKIACEQTAENLRKHGISAEFYHAGLGADERHSVQEQWQAGRFQIICATIAFGMGIDKADVRFVIHYSLPRTMEGYYQEAGRAGRDGKPSHCVLFYSYRDATSIATLIDKDETITNKDHQKQLLKRVVQYCENRADCRRQQVLQYFNEKFDVSKCRNSCDNCKDGAGRTLQRKDVTEIAKEIIQLVEYVQKDQVTILHCVDVYRGLRNKKVTESEHHLCPMHGKGKNLDRTELDRIFHHLLSEGILKEYSHYNRAGFAQSYIKKGPNAGGVLSGREKVNMNVYIEKNPVNMTPVNKKKRASTGDNGSGSSSRSTGVTTNSRPGAKTSSKSASKRQKTDDWQSQEERYAEMELVREDVRSRLQYSTSQEVCSDESLRQISEQLPTSLDEFKQMKGLSAVQTYKMYKYFRPVLVRLRDQGSMADEDQSFEIENSQVHTSKHFKARSTVKGRVSSRGRGGSRGRGTRKFGNRKSTSSTSGTRGIRAMPM